MVVRRRTMSCDVGQCRATSYGRRTTSYEVARFYFVILQWWHHTTPYDRRTISYDFPSICTRCVSDPSYPVWPQNLKLQYRSRVADNRSFLEFHPIAGDRRGSYDVAAWCDLGFRPLYSTWKRSGGRKLSDTFSSVNLSSIRSTFENI